jgi:hypothetical protein
MRARSGFALVEAMVAMVIIVIGALALATTDRQQALALATQQIDRLRSLPYKEVGLAAPPPGNPNKFDVSRAHTDWRTAYCPLDPVSKCAPGGLIITLNDKEAPPPPAVAAEEEPRRAKRVQTGSVAPNNSYLENGLIIYSYIYWPDLNSINRGRKVISVVVRFRDRSDGTADAAFGTVRLSAVVVDNPGLGQIPEPE